MDDSPALPGLRQLNLKKSFKLAVRSLLTTCSKQDFMDVFSTVDRAKQEALYLIFIQVITSLHQNIEEEFESLCLETQDQASGAMIGSAKESGGLYYFEDPTYVTRALDIVEQLVEEQALDILPSDTTSLVDVKQKASNAKKDEVAYLTGMLEKIVKQNDQAKAQIESLKNERVESLHSGNDVGKWRSWNSNYGQQGQQ